MKIETVKYMKENLVDTVRNTEGYCKIKCVFSIVLNVFTVSTRFILTGRLFLNSAAATVNALIKTLQFVQLFALNLYQSYSQQTPHWFIIHNQTLRSTQMRNVYPL